MEANTPHTTTAGDFVDSARSSLRTRLAGLLPARSANGNGAGRTAPRPADDLDARFDESLAGTKTVVLHHREIPGDPEEVSHVIIAPSGITLVDSSNYTSGRARVGHGGIHVGRRNRSDLIDRILDQVDGLYDLLADTPYADVPIEAALAWRQVEGLPILHSFNAPRVLVCGVQKITREAARPGPLSTRRVNALGAFLENELPAA